MQIIKYLDNLLRARIYHGENLFVSAKTLCSKASWLVTVICVFLLMCWLLKSTAREFYQDESIVATSTKSPTKFPVLHICPTAIPDEVVEAAGYSKTMSKYLAGLLKPGHSNLSSFEENVFKTQIRDDNMLKDKSVQQVLHQIGIQHKRMLQPDVNMTFLLLELYEANESISLNDDGYCFTFTLKVKEDLIPQVIRYMLLEVGFKNSSIVKKTNGFRVALTTRPEDYIMPPIQPLPTNHLINVNSKWQFKKSRNTKQETCSEQSVPIYECIADCETMSNVGEHCEIYSPKRNQTLENMCYPPKSVASRRGSNNTTVCQKNCRRPCEDGHFLYIAQVSKMGLNRTGFYQLFYLAVLGVDGSMHFLEAKKITLSMLVSYFGGNLGCFLGFHVLALVQYLNNLMISKFNPIRHFFDNHNRRKQAEHYTLWFVVFCASSTFLISLWHTFAKERTTTVVPLGRLHVNHFPKILLMTNWIDERKIYENLPLSDDFVAEEDERVISENFTFPFLCSFIYSLPMGTPIMDVYDNKIPGFKGQVKKLEKIVQSSDVVRQRGLDPFFQNLIASPSDRIESIQNDFGQTIDYASTIRRIASGYVFEISINTSSKPEFVNSQSGLTIRLPKWYNHHQDKCLHVLRGRYLIFRSYDEGVGMKSDIQGFDEGFGDAEMIVRIQSVKIKNTPSKPCIEGIPDNSHCYAECYDKYEPCACQAMFYGEKFVANITNISTMCHRLQSPFQQCQLLRFLDTKLLAKCENLCPQECERMFYHTEVHKTPASDLDTMAIRIKFETESNNLNVEEFYVYDLISFLCALASVFSFFFGYSFISTVYGSRLVVDVAAKFRR